MTIKNTELALLPSGFADLLPARAEGEARSVHILMQKFTAFGYERVKPPLLEFEASLLAPGPGEQLSAETFRLMDPVSHRMLGLRSDITPQIARIVSSRLGNEPRPLRLTYANDVLRTKGNQLRTERQFTQVGCEIVGGESGLEADIEVCVLAVLGLKDLGMSGLTIDFTVPHFVSRLLKGTEAAQAAQIEKAVSLRDRDALSRIGGKAANAIATAMADSGSYKKALSALRAINAEAGIAADIDHLQKVCTGVQAALDDLGIADISMTVDVLEQAGFEYHKTLGFTLFSGQVHGELGRGGCYDVRFGSPDIFETARGFTLYMDTVGRGVPAAETPKKLAVSFDEKWNNIKSLQEQGWVVVRGAGNNTGDKSCTHVYKGGKILEKKD